MRTECFEVEIKSETQSFIERISLVSAHKIGEIDAKNVVT